MKREVSCFVSPHGFGHATRTIAILEELVGKFPDLHINFISTVPRSLIARTELPITHHSLIVDIGLIQDSAFRVSRQKTAAALNRLLPFRPELIDHCAEICRASQIIICDISALGIVVAKHLGVPSILIENFTWDWIYDLLNDSELSPFSRFFQEQYAKADYHIQTEPVCRKIPDAIACQPIARRPRSAIKRTQKAIGSDDRKVVLITMGGFPLHLPFVKQLSEFTNYHFVLAGQQEHKILGENTLLLSYDTDLYHPDLIQASDLVVCKSGYSTIAECAQSTTSICSVSRSDFPESAVLERFVHAHLNGVTITPEEFSRGDWLAHLPQFVATRRKASPTNGAAEVVQLIASLLYR